MGLNYACAARVLGGLVRQYTRFTKKKNLTVNKLGGEVNIKLKPRRRNWSSSASVHTHYHLLVRTNAHENSGQVSYTFSNRPAIFQ